jgi:hypothetical protein
MYKYVPLRASSLLSNKTSTNRLNFEHKTLIRLFNCHQNLIILRVLAQNPLLFGNNIFYNTGNYENHKLH